MKFDKIEKKLKKSYKVYHSKTKEALTLFVKSSGLFKASIVRHETYPTPQFVYDLHIDNVPDPEGSRHYGIETNRFLTKTIIETYDTFEEAVNALLKHV